MMLFNVQVLRGVSAAIVIWVHAQSLVLAGVSGILSEFGYGGVDLFFVISGFIMVHTTRSGMLGPIGFLKKRLSRIVPLYYFFTIATVLLVILMPSVMRSSEARIDHLAYSLLFLPFEKAPYRIYPVYYLGWTLNFEIFFYLIYGALLQLGYGLRIAAVTVLLAALAFAGTWIDTPASYGTAAFFYTRPIILDFALGVLVAHYFSVPRKVRNSLWWCLLAVGGLGMIFGGLFFGFGQSAFAPPMNTTLRFGLPAALVLAGAVGLEQVGIRIGTPLMRAVGDASYSIYLSHYFFVGIVIVVAGHLSFGAGFQYFLAIATCVAAVALGVLVFRLLERPLAGDLGAYRRMAKLARGGIGRLASNPVAAQRVKYPESRDEA